MTCSVRLEPADAEPREVFVEPGTTLLAAVVAAGLPIARSCASEGLCAGCGLVVLEGAASLSTEEPAEAAAKRRNRTDPAERLACRARVHGAVVASARYW